MSIQSFDQHFSTRLSRQVFDNLMHINWCDRQFETYGLAGQLIGLDTLELLVSKGFGLRGMGIRHDEDNMVLL